MRKIYLFFALLIGISSAAWATDFTPEDGAIYTIKNKAKGTYALYNSGCNKTDGTNILSTWAQYDQRSFFIIEGNATNGYTLRFKNETTRYVMAVNTNDEDSNVGTITVADGATVPESAKWKIVENGTGTWNIIPFAGSRGWNQRGSLNGNNCVGQWGTNDSDDNRWYIQKPSEMAAAAITARGDYDESWSGKIGMPTEEGWNAWNTAVTTTASTLQTTFSVENATAFKNAFFTAIALKTPSNGLYKIQNVGTSLYLFQTNEDNPKNITLINDGGNNSKYYWKASFDGNVVSLTGSLGQAPSRGGQSAVYSNISSGVVMNTITMEGAPSGSASYTEGAFLWPTVHTTNQQYYTVKGYGYDYNTETNPLFLTTWTTPDGADQYTFEAVTLTGDQQVYTVNVNTDVYNCDANVTFNSDSYTGNKTVNNGGFFILTSSEAQPENFSAVNINGLPYYPATVSIEGTTINVTYTFDIEKQASYYVANSEANKVGYPTSTSQVVKDLKSALGTYQADQSEDNRSALSTAITAYKNETSDISMPVDGKAYKFTSVSYDGTLRYIKYSSSAGVTLSDFASDATPYICRKIEEGKYAFVNNDGKYLIWKGKDNGRNDNKGYADAYDQSFTIENVGTYTDWAKFTLIKLTQNNNNIQSGVTNSDLTGFVSMKARRNAANSYIIVTNSTNSFNQAGENDTYFNTSHSTALLMEEVPYANVVSLKDASGLESGKNIATFSAPFPTVVPANTTAYSVETQMASNVAEVSTYKVAEAGEAIPANTGVILMGTETQVTMLPRTTETTVVIAEGALGNSAGAAKDITTENSYVLSNQSSLWAFYKVGAGATALPMNKAYLVLPESSESVIRFNLVGTTGLDLVGADNAAAQGKVYDLSGREVKAAAKGLYIVGGKKVIVK